MPGMKVNTARIVSRKISMVRYEMSRSVRSTTTARADTWRVICCIPSRKDSIIVGMERMSVISPPVATAPAPM